ncbi:30S ribosome-binding factor RbfA [Amphritea sp. 2_MG-2023]|uniref:30S ribosome-binding factor RbfA n=1 Tax=Amphritea TaxID=515417 RepID=UPI001C074EDC|nr:MULTISPECIES: 30S ribosome-binding factor RbfA [Amphritea]MBU2966842.1 30S ribosome-binding factor RbfA [Amphritea atlantica]MDO6420058.1 30S ribosome-binding factor RbfA [Amphritea sp. 2_MG-2023]
MAREFSRTQRISDQVQKDLAQLIQREIKDPRLGMVTISYVKIAKDLGYADIYITVMAMGGKDEATAVTESLKVLNSASGFLRGQLSSKIKLRVMPQLRFHFDESVDRGRRLNDLIIKATREDGQHAQDDEE